MRTHAMDRKRAKGKRGLFSKSHPQQQPLDLALDDIFFTSFLEYVLENNFDI